MPAVGSTHRPCASLRVNSGWPRRTSPTSAAGISLFTPRTLQVLGVNRSTQQVQSGLTLTCRGTVKEPAISHGHIPWEVSTTRPWTPPPVNSSRTRTNYGKGPDSPTLRAHTYFSATAGGTSSSLRAVLTTDILSRLPAPETSPGPMLATRKTRYSPIGVPHMLFKTLGTPTWSSAPTAHGRWSTWEYVREAHSPNIMSTDGKRSSQEWTGWRIGQSSCLTHSIRREQKPHSRTISQLTACTPDGFLQASTRAPSLPAMAKPGSFSPGAEGLIDRSGPDTIELGYLEGFEFRQLASV